jgi:putative hydrolase of HD superfamily
MDRLKSIMRQTPLLDGSRKENDAEHSWHLAMLVLILAEYAEGPVDALRVLKMVLVHDIVEIDAGDTYCYHPSAHHDKLDRETRAAERIFGLLPADQASELRALWDEFEARETPEARFANTVDRVQPLLHNCLTGGLGWREHGVKLSQVLQRNRPILLGSQRLWVYMAGLLRAAVAAGHLEDDVKDTWWPAEA